MSCRVAGLVNQMLLYTDIYLRHRALSLSEEKLPVRSTRRVSCLPSCLDPCDLTRSSKFHSKANSRHEKQLLIHICTSPNVAFEKIMSFTGVIH